MINAVFLHVSVLGVEDVLTTYSSIDVLTCICKCGAWYGHCIEVVNAGFSIQFSLVTQVFYSH